MASVQFTEAIEHLILGRILMKIVLASGSPRRRELLTGLGLDYRVLVSGVEERVTETEPAKVVEQLSAQKAWDVLRKLRPDISRECTWACAGKSFGEQTLTSAEVVSEGHSGANGNEEELLVIGADTLVAVDGLILGKPADPKDAAEMLRRLSDRRHQVYTGVTLYLSLIHISEPTRH